MVSRLYKTNHPHLMRQGGHTLNLYNKAVADRLSKEHHEELDCAELCSTIHDLQGATGNYWAALESKDTDKCAGSCMKEQDYTRHGEDKGLQFTPRKKPAARGHIIHSWDILLGYTRTSDYIATAHQGHMHITGSQFSGIWFERWKECGTGHNHQSMGESLHRV